MLSLAVAVSGCAGELSTLDPAGPAAAAIAQLWWVMLAGSAAIFFLTALLLGLAFRDHGRTDEARLERIWIRGLGLALPLATLAALLTHGLVTTSRLEDSGDAVILVEARAGLQGWRFFYADLPGRATEGVLHIPAGRPVRVMITTEDVIHSFWVPRLAGKRDAIPGHINSLDLTAAHPGIFAGASSEYSGPGYSGLRFRVHAHDAQGWNAFLDVDDG